MQDTTKNTGEAQMRPRARLVKLIGDELISDEPVALVELVKNAYDADASVVNVVFEGADPDSLDRIIVEDDGFGMCLDDILNKWLEPGTISKRGKEMTPKGRILQGAKGIGRFASARLAERLILESKMLDHPGVVIIIDWGVFDDDKYLEEVIVEWEEADPTSLPHGTRITLEGLRKNWNAKDFTLLHSRLGSLISPFNDVVDFDIHIAIPGNFTGHVTPPEIIMSPRYRLEGCLTDDGMFTGQIEIEGKDVHFCHDLRIRDKNTSVLCGPFMVEIRAWDRDTESLKPLADRFGQSVTKLRSTLNEYCGVGIYRDGFRVHPYGQKGEDWLNLDLRSRQNPSKNLANNQIVASIRIGRDRNPNVIDRSTREGLVINDEFKDLQQWFEHILNVLEGHRYKAKPRSNDVRADAAFFDGLDLKDEVQAAQKSLGPDHPVAKLMVQADKRVRDRAERIQEHLNRLLTLSGLGQMVDLVMHEIGAPLGKINRRIEIFENKLLPFVSGMPGSCHGSESKWFRDQVPSNIRDIKEWCEQINLLRDRLDTQTPAKRGKATAFDVREEIANTLDLFSMLIDRQKIVVKCDIPTEPFMVKMSRASLGQVMSNLVDNALYWLTKHHGKGSGGLLQIDLDPLPSGFKIIVADNGPGISEEDKERIFDSYYTTKPAGMGLGLYVARLAMDSYGKLLCSDNCDQPGACFEAIFERSIGR
ncbi:sensor histidine kinase [Fundidesulfovibrio putealis]|uniref:sensor histidine kinase n=1 Tax=Fundidesulfovibrio putealis TaxID=270496 RepID=UPI000413A7B9|nr:sensor histidine kinase [Fundidesulfovibrio putealis]